MRAFYDLLILGFLFADGLLIFLLAVVSRNNRGQSLRLRRQDESEAKGIFRRFPLVFIAVAVAAWLIIFYGSFIEPRLLVVKTYKIGLVQSELAILPASPASPILTTPAATPEAPVTQKIPATLRVALVSDLHLGPYKKDDYAEKVVLKIVSEKSDLVILAGDFVFGDQDQVEYLTPLKNLRAPLGVFAVLGNHDYGETQGNFGIKGEKRAMRVQNKLASLGIKVLINEGAKIAFRPSRNEDAPLMRSQDVTFNDREIFLLGTDDLWTRRADIQKSLQSLNLNRIPHLSILISHNPDIVMTAEKLGVDLVLAGHTHAGQIRLPLIGSVPPIPDSLGRKYDKGLFQFGSSTKIFITSGVGESGPRARLFNPPEISMLEINL